MDLADIDKRVVLLLGVLVMGAASFLWYSKMYSPAVAAQTAAAQSLTTTQQAKASKEAELSAAKTTQSKKVNASRSPDAEARILLSRLGIAPTQDLDEMLIQIADVSKRTGLRVVYDIDQGDAASSGGLTDEAAAIPGVTPVDITFTGSGPSYASILLFIEQLNDAVDSSRGQVYVRGRLLNLMSFIIGQMKDDAEGDDSSEPDKDSDPVVVPDGWVKYEFVIRAYTFDAGAMGTTDPGAPTDPGADATTADGAATADATAGAPTAGDAASPDPALTTPSTSTTPGAAV